VGSQRLAKAGDNYVSNFAGQRDDFIPKHFGNVARTKARTAVLPGEGTHFAMQIAVTRYLDLERERLVTCPL